MNYKILFSVLSLLFIFLLASGTAFAADPIQITTTDDFMKIGDSGNLGQDYILMNDIDFTGKTFTPIGSESNPFTGTFNGNNKTISNITFSDNTMDNVGLFGSAEGASFSNIILKNVKITGHDNVGSLLGQSSNTTIQFCSVDNSTVSGNLSVGGFVGHLIGSSSVITSSATGNIDGNVYVGGFVGEMNDSSSVSAGFASVDVDGKNSHVGGFVGIMRDSSSVSDSFATGNVSSVYSAGGFVDTMVGSSSVINSFATGNVAGNGHVGGFVGSTSFDASISESSATGNVNGKSYTGGFVGSMSYSSSILASSATGNVAGDEYVGGFVGSMSTSSSVSTSYAIGNAVGTHAVGGFVGSLNNADASVSKSYATGDATGTNEVGGFVGLLSNGASVSESYATGNAKGYNYVGGFVGEMLYTAFVFNSYATGDAAVDVTGDDIGTKYVGGFVGRMDIGGVSEIHDSLYIGLPDSKNNARGVRVTPATKLMQINTFKKIGEYVSTDWNISSSPDLKSVWYINEGNGYPLFYWSSEFSSSRIVTFDTLGGTVILPQKVNDGDSVIQPDDPAKDGYTFVEWQLNGAAYDFKSPVTGNLALVAFYQADTLTPTPTYEVTFNSDGGTAISPQTINDGNTVTQPANPVKDGYIFVEWQLNGAAYDFKTPVTGPLNLIAIYTPVVVSHTVTFDSDGSTAIPSQKVNDGDLVTQPANPVKADYTFVRWELNGAAYDFSTPVAGNLTLVAVYEATSATTYTVTFNSDGGTSLSPKNINGGDLVTQPTPNPAKAGYVFKEWQLNGIKYDFSTPVNKDFTLIAIYTAESGNSGGGGGNGGGTGSAKIVGNAPQNNTPQNNTPQNNEPQNNEPQNNEPQNNTPQDNTLQNNNSTKGKSSNSLIWWGLGAVLLIVLIGGIVYVFSSKKK